ncbi:RNA polymerase sigma factor [Reinekea blandensis]|uniref:Sigma-24 (FecI-like) protein n=1 Tax=Reinekea blandensis MED297 TaxID=314283 RepID=A4BAT1_9GAMM|nr:RNA polymerase sigma factor [Reinekea blandensis]EAR10544.1 sigma-24 (FecI-like) protein [Reinekea sp. MED297] [Reinekea blandensis MED297]
MSLISKRQWQVEVNQLLAALRKGHHAAFNELYSKTTDRLHHLVISIVQDEHIAVDVLQEAYINVWTHRHRFELINGDAWSWLCQVFRNKAIDYYRTHKRTLRATENSARPEPYRESTQEWENTIDLKRILNPLNAKQRHSLISSYVLGYSHQELADEFNEPLGTVKSRIRRTLKQLESHQTCLQ